MGDKGQLGQLNYEPKDRETVHLRIHSTHAKQKCTTRP